MRIYLIIFFCFFTILGCDKRITTADNINTLDTTNYNNCAPPPTLIFNFTLKGEPVQSYTIRAHFIYYFKNGEKKYLLDFGRIPFTHSFYSDTYGTREITIKSYVEKINTFYMDYWDNSDIDTITLVTTGGKRLEGCIYTNNIKFNGHEVRSEPTSWGPQYPLILFDK